MLSELSERAPEVCRRVGEAGAVHVDAQVVGRAEVMDLPQLRQRVAGADLGRLGDRHHAWLGEMLVAAPRQAAGDQLGCELAARRGHGQQLGPEDALGRPALVGVDVRRLRADDGLMPAEQQPKPEYVRAAAIEDQVHLALRTSEPPQFASGSFGPRVRAIGDGIADVGVRDRAHDGGVYPGVVVAAEALPCHRRGHPAFRAHAEQGVADVFMPASLFQLRAALIVSCRAQPLARATSRSRPRDRCPPLAWPSEACWCSSCQARR